jgi:hypothetical protein
VHKAPRLTAPRLREQYTHACLGPRPCDPAHTFAQSVSASCSRLTSLRCNLRVAHVGNLRIAHASKSLHVSFCFCAQCTLIQPMLMSCAMRPGTRPVRSSAQCTFANALAMMDQHLLISRAIRIRHLPPARAFDGLWMPRTIHICPPPFDAARTPPGPTCEDTRSWQAKTCRHPLNLVAVPPNGM